MEATNMQVGILFVARRLHGACLALLALLLVSCATSPTEQLSRAESLLQQLEKSGAEAYLKYELAATRRQIEEAKRLIRKNHFERASQQLYSLCQRLDSCGVAFLQLRQLAQQRSQYEVFALSARIDSLRGLVNKIPRQSYIDQNRFDIYMHRLRRYRDEADILKRLIEQEEFPLALQRSKKLEFQVKQSITSLLETSAAPSTMVASARAPKQEKPPLVAAGGRSSSR
jgi:hypothetical protein